MHMPTWATIVTGIAGVAGIAGVLSNVGKILSFAGSVLSWVRKRFDNKDDALPDLPRKTIVAIRQPRINALWWSMGRAGEKPMLQVVGDFNVSNVWTDNVRLAGALVRYKRWGIARTEHGDASVKDLRSQYSGNYPIPPNQMTWVRVGFHFAWKHREPGKRLKADIAIIDQFGNHHWLRGLVFKHVNAMLD